MVYNIIPSENVKYDDIRDTLNAGGGSVNNDVASAFKSAANTNIWSKYKPVRNTNKIIELVDSDFYDANYGIGNTPYWIRLASMKTGFIENNPLPENMTTFPVEGYWSYLNPVDETYPKRLADFRGYFAKAEAPIGAIDGEEITVKSDNLAIIMFPMGAINNYTLKLSDLGIMGSGGDVTERFTNMYLGLCIYNNNKTYFVTQSNTIKTLHEVGNTFKIDEANTIVGSWNAFLFISDRQLPSIQTADAIIGKYLPIPGTQSTFTIKPYIYDFDITVDYAYRKDNRTIEYRYVIYNNEPSKYVTDGITIELLNASNVVLGSTSNAAVGINAESSYTKTATIVTLAANVTNATALRVRTTITGQEVIGLVMITDDRPPIIG